jgi:hypothetical protein
VYFVLFFSYGREVEAPWWSARKRACEQFGQDNLRSCTIVGHEQREGFISSCAQFKDAVEESPSRCLEQEQDSRREADPVRRTTGPEAEPETNDLTT